MKHCINCKKDSPDDATECIHCGTYLLDCSEGETNYKNQEYGKIRGILIIVAIGRILAPLIMLFSLKSFYDALFTQSGLELIEKISTIGHAPDFKAYITFDFYECAIIILLDLIVLYLFFRKKKIFPKVMIAFCVVMLLEAIFKDTMLSSIFSLGSTLRGENKALVAPLISAIIWIPYFTRSERVKNTFVN
ncbi:DUF2569 domain-containing protein [Inconstantimicrobium mannanitabidum]|uniref:Uncharacterized protein n=1 Tax=Inconstantimicrobium mannanitabidum TaxID=1604901 RepID=A0ACB5RA35_9CLOT|nr:DUF2569 domain-containing protein [Clostridium sp. TW13]GKX65901.1 hypothetical protein rsdtw13_11590 [Clostridium sp. TW13]